MNYLLFLSAILAIALGIIHSILGERLIFKQLRNAQKSDRYPEKLAIRQLQALWSTWHLVTLFGWAVAGILICFASPISPTAQLDGARLMITVLFSVSTLVWIIGTRGKHPAWIIFLTLALLTYLA